MTWFGTIANNVLRNIVFTAPPPNMVLTVKTDQYSNRLILCREDGIVLYRPGDKGIENKYEIILHRPCTETLDQAYSLYRTDDIAEGETHFLIYKDKVPVLVQISREMSNVSKIQRLCDTLVEHPTWTLAHLAAHFALYEAFKNTVVNSQLNSSDLDTGVSPLQVAVQTKNLRTVQMLKAANSSLEHTDKQGNTVYHYAATSTKDIILTIKGLSNSLNSRNNDGYTPLHIACMNDEPECVKALLLIGADVNIPPSDGQPSSPGYVGDFLHNKPNVLYSEDMRFGGTPLHWSHSRPVVNALIEHHVDIDAVNFQGRTALHVMVIRKRLDCVVALLSHMASVNKVDQDGNTPLHLAVSSGTIAIVQVLVGFGADINARNWKSETPRHMINLNNNDGQKILYILHAVGAQRCPYEMKDCNIGCKYDENYNGIRLNEVPRSMPRTTLDQMLHVSGMEVMASFGKRKMKGGRLLCLDGGGIRGLVLIQTLLEIESILKKPVIECFDWVAGTSTGGILALGLASGKSLKECQALYFRIKEDAFVGFRPYNSEGLENILKDCLGPETVMADIERPKLMITGVLADRKPVDLHLFRNYESPSELLDVPRNTDFKDTLSPAEQLLWKAARATGAAPSYFRAFGRFLDGGLIANNPTLDAITEIHEYNLALKAVKRESEVIPLSLVVSLGTGLIPVEPLTDIDVFRPEGLWDTAKVAMGITALGSLLVDQATASDGRVVDRARTWCSMIGVPYYRFNPQLSIEIAMDEKKDEILADMIWTAKAFMHANRNQINELAAVINRDE
ncbi:85/88 kDa calcium-independent phospholipase A2-like [Vespa mandarinia]|uniref:85/88 kDa calcium-independent phospholipase A2-like n=1 Tax=Vespa mandarinia TaxID=7446 RepID=UPI00160A1235|nr:85/88 kDa calcium-independent phospholipase A2-like [Vespa mandarinia]XP_035721624.1 85/88 kDa calcium-independent phospholipase A2-like [Vespa mandarinia]XP_035721625.1 85/88 kDa calcium-independent phospholipase A2-like [Vespa mandarinia]